MESVGVAYQLQIKIILNHFEYKSIDVNIVHQTQYNFKTHKV